MMLRVCVALLACLPLLQATPFDCEHRFHRLHKEKDGKKSDCDLVARLVGPEYTIQTCREMACRLSGNAINFHETKDKFDDNVCEIRTCYNDGPKVVPDNEGYSVLYSDYEPSLKCCEEAGRTLACWTCKDEPDEEACLKNGRYEVCENPDSRCQVYKEKDLKQVTRKVTRQCVPSSDCTASMYSRVGQCHPETYFHLSDVSTGCYHCGYGYNHHRCFDVKPNLQELVKQRLTNMFALIHHSNDGKEVSCDMIINEEEGYTEESCQRLAVALGGNVAGHRYGTHCRIYKCEVGQGVKSLKLEDHDHGWDVFALTTEFSCEKDLGRELECFTCHGRTEAECRESGKMKRCGKNEDTCSHERRINPKQEVTDVIRGCKNSAHCTSSMWSENIWASCSPVGKSQICENCGLGKPGADHTCHHAFNTKCLDTFREVKEDHSNKPQTSTCTQVAYQKHHSKESCLNLACQLNSNVIHFGGSACEVYICELDKHENPVFRNKKNRHMKVYTRS